MKKFLIIIIAFIGLSASSTNEPTFEAQLGTAITLQESYIKSTAQFNIAATEIWRAYEIGKVLKITNDKYYDLTNVIEIIKKDSKGKTWKDATRSNIEAWCKKYHHLSR